MNEKKERFKLNLITPAPWFFAGAGALVLAGEIARLCGAGDASVGLFAAAAAVIAVLFLLVVIERRQDKRQVREAREAAKR